MAFKTFTDGNVLTDTDLNDYLMKQTVIVCTSGSRPSSPVEGMVIYETDTDSIRAYDGSSWVAVWYRQRPLAQLRQTSAQTLANNTWTAITFQLEYADNVGGHSTVTNTSRYTSTVDGYYEVSGAVCLAATSAGSGWARWARNGTEWPGSGTNMVNTTSQMLLPARTVIIALGVGDYVELQGFQLSGGNLDTFVATDWSQSTMTVKWVAP